MQRYHGTVKAKYCPSRIANFVSMNVGPKWNVVDETLLIKIRDRPEVGIGSPVWLK